MNAASLAYSSLSLSPVTCRGNAAVTQQAGVDGATVSRPGHAGLLGADRQPEGGAYRLGLDHNRGCNIRCGNRAVAAALVPVEEEWKVMMLQVHAFYNLKRYELARDAAYVAELRAELYGDPYVVIDCGGLGFAAIRKGDIELYGLQPWQIRSTWEPDLDPAPRRKRLSEMLMAATGREEQVTA